MKQSELGEAAAMKQARISSMERIGEAKFSVETLVRLAAAFRVGIEVRFVEFSEMLAWENEYQPDHFDVFPLEKDENFISPRVRDEQIKVDGGIWFATTAQDNTLNSSKASQISNIEGRSVLDQQSHFPLADMKSISIGASA
jgi:transcriptional regulator with XRE-family HTH domain